MTSSVTALLMLLVLHLILVLCLSEADYVNLTIYPICHRLFVLAGQRLNLTCEADRQLAAFSWTRRTISGCETAPLNDYDGFHVDSGDGSTSSRLVKTEVVHDDEGVYECSGSDGSHQGSYPLHVLVVNMTLTATNTSSGDVIVTCAAMTSHVNNIRFLDEWRCRWLMDGERIATQKRVQDGHSVWPRINNQWHLIARRPSSLKDEKAAFARQYECRCSAPDSQNFSKFINVTFHPLLHRHSRQHFHTGDNGRMSAVSASEATLSTIISSMLVTVIFVT